MAKFMKSKYCKLANQRTRSIILKRLKFCKSCNGCPILLFFVVMKLDAEDMLIFDLITLFFFNDDFFNVDSLFTLHILVPYF